MTTAYCPPNKRNAPDNIVSTIAVTDKSFPMLGASPKAPPKPTLSFLEHVKQGEAARQAKEELKHYDPAMLETLTIDQLTKEGWAVLNLKDAKNIDFGALKTKIPSRKRALPVSDDEMDDEDDYVDDDADADAEDDLDADAGADEP